MISGLLSIKLRRMDFISDVNSTVLIIDDNVQYSKVLTKMLQQGFGYQNITVVHTLEEGYKLIAENPTEFKLLFIDFRFPTGGTGGDLLKRLSDERLLEAKAAFLITSEPNVDNVKMANDSGAMGVVAKPFDREQLKKQLEKAKRSILVDSNDSF